MANPNGGPGPLDGVADVPDDEHGPGAAPAAMVEHQSEDSYEDFEDEFFDDAEEGLDEDPDGFGLDEDDDEDDDGDAEAVGPSSEPVDPVLDRGLKQHGCEHYRRRVKVVAPCCDEAYWCRHCHNAVCNESEPDPNKRHVLDRKAVKEVVCALCGLRQDKARTCAGCGVAFGRYVCLICSFFDDDTSKGCFHCQDCGICRVGGQANFFHCRTCNCCYALSLQHGHVCIEDSMKRPCPVCQEYLFDSIRPINIMPQCGHTIHQDCLRSLAENSTYTCPLCMKSIMAPTAMQRVWDNLDSQVQSTPMPTEYASISVKILCNDCNARSNVSFHVLGNKCRSCGSYNTRRT